MSDLLPPEAGSYAELGQGILWIRLPIPGGLHHINTWLLPVPDGWWLVDTGMQTDAVRQAWLDLEGRLPLGRELRGIVVTHHHPDHFGMARWLSARHDVPVAMTAAAHAAAMSSLARGSAQATTPAAGFTRRLGLEPDKDMRRILHGGIYRSIVSGPVDAELLDGGPALGGSWQVSIHEGHAPGHACFHDRSAGILVSGDQLLPSISSNISLYPSNEEEDPLGQYLHSLDALCSLPEDTMVLPSHGRPFSTLHVRAQQLRTEHAARLEDVRGFVAMPASTRQVTQRLFRLERLDALNRLLATTETLAHLRWLELRGQVVRSGAGDDLRWSATGR